MGLGRVFGERTARSRTLRGPADALRPAVRPPPRLGGHVDGGFRRPRVVAWGPVPTVLGLRADSARRRGCVEARGSGRSRRPG